MNWFFTLQFLYFRVLLKLLEVLNHFEVQLFLFLQVNLLLLLLYYSLGEIFFEVKTPMLVESNRLLDFGPGFYTTTNREQARRFAESVVSKRGGTPMINSYEFDEAAFSECLVKKFDSPSEAWLDFVAANRSGNYVGERYDLIVGPVANDNVYATIGLYMRGFISKESAVNELRVRKLYDQIVFATPKTFRYLKHIGTEVL